MDKWNANDESLLNGLIAKKQAFYDRHRAPLRELVTKMLTTASAESVANAWAHDLALELEINADLLRDLLAPFDSGIRVANPNIEAPPTVPYPGQLRDAAPVPQNLWFEAKHAWPTDANAVIECQYSQGACGPMLIGKAGTMYREQVTLWRYDPQ